MLEERPVLAVATGGSVDVMDGVVVVLAVDRQVRARGGSTPAISYLLRLFFPTASEATRCSSWAPPRYMRRVWILEGGQVGFRGFQASERRPT